MKSSRFVFKALVSGWCSMVISVSATADLISNSVIDDWSGVDCPGGMFSSFNLSGDSFGDNDFTGADFSMADLSFSVAFGPVTFTDADLGSTDLTGALFADSHLEGADFSNAILSGADFSTSYPGLGSSNPTRFDGAVADGLQLFDCDFSNGLSIVGANFAGANLQYVTVFAPGVDFSDTDFSNANLADSVFGDPEIGGTNFSNAMLSRADFTLAQTFNSANPVNFNNVTADGLVMDFANITTDFSAVGGNFTGANLNSAVFFGWMNDLSDANFSGADLANVWVTNPEIGGADFSGATLSDADFSLAQTASSFNPVVFDNAIANGIKLTTSSFNGDFSAIDADFQNADLEGVFFTGLSADFSGANLTGAMFMNAGFPVDGTSFAWADLSNCILDNSEMGGADFTGATMSGAQLQTIRTFNSSNPMVFDYAIADGLKLTYGDIGVVVSAIGADFTGADFNGTIFASTDADFSDANFSGANLTGISLPSIQTSFRNADLSFSILSGSDIGGADFTGATLTDADLTLIRTTNSSSPLFFEGAIAGGMKLRDADVQAPVFAANADFNGSDFGGTIFAGTTADFSDTDFSGANLANVSFPSIQTSFRNANLSFCILSDSDIGGVDFSGATLTDANLDLIQTFNSSELLLFDGAVAGGVSMRDADVQASVSAMSADFSGADFSNTIFAGATVDFSNANFSGAYFTGAHLSASSTSFTFADLSNCNMMGAEIGGVNFTGATLTNADLRTVTTWNHINPLILDHVTANGLNISTTTFDGTVSAVGADFTGADFSGADFTNAQTVFAAANFTNTIFTGALLPGAVFSDAIFSGSDVSDLQLKGASSIAGIVLDGNNLAGFNLSSEVIAEGSFVATMLDGADFSNSDLRNADFRNSTANAVGVNFDNAQLSGADFSGASFLGGTPAPLKKVEPLRIRRDSGDTVGFSAAGADLTGTKFDGATLAKADFRGAKLMNASGLTSASFTTPPVYDEETDFGGTGVDPETGGWQLFAVPEPVMTSSGGEITIVWEGIAGLEYQVQSTSDLSGWTGVSALIPGAASHSFTHTPSGGSRTFYRVAVFTP